MQIHYRMYLNWTGYSVAAQDYILAMLSAQPDLDIRTSFYNRATSLGVSKDREKIFRDLHNKPAAPMKEQIQIYHCIPFRYQKMKEVKANVGFCIFESVTLPDDWVRKSNQTDYLITASQFNCRNFIASHVKVPIRVVPHTFDESLFNVDVQPMTSYDEMTFMSIGTWKQRKNWPLLVKAYFTAFEKKDNVRLVMKCDRPKDMKQMVKEIKKKGDWTKKDTGPITIEEKPYCSFEDIPRLMKSANVYVSCSMGEGFGLTGMQAMALGIATILPRFGGVQEYAKPEITTFLQPDHYERIPIVDRVPQFRDRVWPIFRIKEVAQKMREIYDNYPQAKVAAAYKHVHENYNYKTIGRQFLSSLGYEP